MNLGFAYKVSGRGAGEDFSRFESKYIVVGVDRLCIDIMRREREKKPVNSSGGDLESEFKVVYLRLRGVRKEVRFEIRNKVISDVCRVHMHRVASHIPDIASL